MKRCTLQLLPDVFVVYITLIGVVTTKKREKNPSMKVWGAVPARFQSLGGAAAPTAPPAGSCVLAPMTAVSPPLNEFEYKL